MPCKSVLLAVVLGGSLAERVSVEARSQSAALIETGEMVQYLQEIEKLQQDVELEFDIAWHYGKGKFHPPSKLEPSHFIQRQKITSVLSNERYRIGIKWTETSAATAPMQNQEQVLTWDGQEARSAVLGSDPEHPTRQGVRIDSQPTQDVKLAGHMDWCGWWVLEGPYFRGYADLLSSAKDIAPVLTDGGITEWRFPSKDWAFAELIVRAERRDGKPVIRSVEQRIYRNQEAYDQRDEERVAISIGTKFEGEVLDNLPIPCEARLTKSHRPIAPHEPFWGVVEIRLQNTRKFEPRVESFKEPVANDAAVADMRYNIAYHLGTKLLNVDGALYESEIPLEGDVGSNLKWWLDRSRKISKEAGAATTQPSSDD